MTNEEKLSALKQWLDENNYEYEENHFSKTTGMIMDLKVRNPRIAVRIGEDQEFFLKVKRYYSPFFIRDNETVEFIIEKMTNCIRDTEERMRRREEYRRAKAEKKEAARLAELERQAELQRKKAEEKPRRRRVRIPMAEKVTPKSHV